MAAPLQHTSHGEIACPDPSMHEKHNRLSEQASTAALYVTHPERNVNTRDSAPQGDILGPDGRLSAKSAATSLKYARAQDLPSFPTVGISTSDSAGKAAMLAKDYKMKELWQPELSSAGSKAALIAARDGGKLEFWQPSPTKDGNSAATMAMRNKGLSPQLDYGYTQDGKQRALQAATLSVHRTRSGSTPIPVTHPAYPDSKNSAYNALNAATASHRANSVKAAPDGWNSEANQAARIKNLNKKINPEMFGDHPPWKDDEEDKHQAALRASAVSMAKQMYEYNNRTALRSDLTGGVQGAEAAAARQAPSAQMDVKQEALRYIHLQDAAHKLAQERLAKIDRNTEAARYREYYGYPDNKPETSPRKPMHRLSIRGRGHNRAGSEGNELDDSDDEEQARRIRGQMSQLGNNLNSVDEKKRSDDRAKLLAAAERRVQASMHDMDEKVFADTGKVTPAMMEEWAAKARKRQQEEKEQEAQHPGMTHIGGGKFISQSEIEAIAAARLKPTLDAINATAEKRRAHDEELRQVREDNEREKREGKQKERDEKEEAKRIKNEEKIAARKEKDEAKARKEEEKRVAKDDKRKSREQKREDVVEVGGAAAGGATATAVTDDYDEHPQTQDSSGERTEKKRDGTLGRWASKLRRNKKAEDKNGVEEGARPESRPDVPAGVSPAGVMIGPQEAPKEDPNLTDDRDDDVSDLEDEDAVRDTEPTNEPYVNIIEPDIPAADATTSPQRPLAPNLERHISHIQDSDDDEDEVEEEQKHGTLSDERARETARRVFGTPHDDVPGASNDTQTASVPQHDQVGPDTAAMGGVATAPAVTHTADDGRIESASSSIWSHDSDIANIVDPRDQTDQQRASTNVKSAESEPTTHSSTVPSGAASAPANAKGNLERPITNDNAVPTSDSANITHPETDDMNKGGLVGLFNRFRGAHKRREQRVPQPEEYQEKASQEASKTSTAENTNALSTETSEKIDNIATEPESPSSFKRGEGRLRDTDDVSSSGAEEEDVGRGRIAGREGGNFMSTGKTSGTLLTSDVGSKKPQRSETTTEDDQFEEARDHFDESLAPPPAFAGQAKNESPVRGTRFREEV